MHIQTNTDTDTSHNPPPHTHTHTEGEAKHSHIRLILYYSFIKTSLLRHSCPPEMHFIIPKSWVSGHIAEIPALSRRRWIMNSYLKTKQNKKTATITKKNKKERCLQSLLQLLFRKPTNCSFPPMAPSYLVCHLPSLILMHRIAFSMKIYVTPQRRSNSLSVYLQRYPGEKAAAFNLCLIICILHFLKEVI